MGETGTTAAGLHAGLLHEGGDGLVEVSGPGYARIPASEITDALLEEPPPDAFRWPGTPGEWSPGPPTHVGIYTDGSAEAPRTAIALPAGAAEGRLELPADALRQLLVGA